MTPRRTIGWESRLDAYLASCQERAFEWGKHDCCRFACHGLVLQGLEDPMAGVRPYRTARGAAGAIRRLGNTLEDAARHLAVAAGLAPVAPAFASRGEVVLGRVETPTGIEELALGLVGLDGRYAHFAAPVGTIRMPVRDCLLAWRVA